MDIYLIIKWYEDSVCVCVCVRASSKQKTKKIKLRRESLCVSVIQVSENCSEWPYDLDSTGVVSLH